MTSIKKDKFKVFSILAGIAFLIIAAAEAVRAVAKVVVPFFAVILRGATSWVSAISNLLSLASPLVFIALAIAAAILILVKKNSVASLIPVALLTYVIFQQFFSYCLSVISSLIASFFNFGIGIQTTFSMITMFASLVCGLICALIFTVIICVAARTFLKKHRFILMFVITAIFALGCIGEILSMFLVVFAFISSILADVNVGSIFNSVWNNLILPIITIGVHCGLMVATGLAAVGMMSKPEAKAVEAVEPVEVADVE